MPETTDLTPEQRAEAIWQFLVARQPKHSTNEGIAFMVQQFREAEAAAVRRARRFLEGG